jgi:MSHA pilin protein MshD
MCINRHQRGLTLIELIMFIVIVGVALAGVLTVLNHTTQHSADPVVRKQALAIAEAILEEVMLQPFTTCDPDDATASTGTCTSVTEAIGPDVNPSGTTETRASTTAPFDNVNDYHGLSTTTNIAGGGSAVYTASVTVVAADLGTTASPEITTASGGALLITVTVAAPSESIQLQGYRTRHSPTMLP